VTVNRLFDLPLWADLTVTAVTAGIATHLWGKERRTP
jgi:hypothetical protein